MEGRLFGIGNKNKKGNKQMKEITAQAIKTARTSRIIRARDIRNQLEESHANRMDFREAMRLERLAKRIGVND